MGAALPLDLQRTMTGRICRWCGPTSFVERPSGADPGWDLDLPRVPTCSRYCTYLPVSTAGSRVFIIASEHRATKLPRNCRAKNRLIPRLIHRIAAMSSTKLGEQIKESIEGHRSDIRTLNDAV